MAIDRITSVAGAIGSTLSATTATSSPAAPDFGDALKTAVGAVEGTAADANQAIGRMLDGTGDIHEAVIAMQKADTTLQLTVQIRNKVVQAYQDIMRMPI